MSPTKSNMKSSNDPVSEQHKIFLMNYALWVKKHFQLHNTILKKYALMYYVMRINFSR